MSYPQWMIDQELDVVGYTEDEWEEPELADEEAARYENDMEMVWDAY